MKTFVKILIPILAIAALIWYAMPQLRAKVTVVKAVRGTAVDAVTGTVKVFANIDIKIKTEVQGRVSEMPAPAGTQVKKGDPIMVLDSEDLNNTIREKVIQLKAAKERLTLPFTQELDILSLKTEVEKLQKQVEFGGASAAELERRQRDLLKLQTDLNSKKIDREEQANLFEATVSHLQYQLSRMSLKATMDGTIVEQYVFSGDYIWVGNEIARLVSPGRWIELTLAEEDSAYVEKGQKAKVHLASYPDKTFEATVSALSSFSNANSKTRTVFMTVDAPDEVLVPGLTGEAVLVKAEHKDTVLIPRRALLGNRVYVVKDGAVEVRRISTGFAGLDQAEITSGLTSGEQIIVEGQSGLRTGDRVIVEGLEDSD